ncbi:hypothetical protein PF005_g26363 [Phytophthora fragariae]|uniref:Uncharacterized protein n=1 Tax=Phytophthora fragariae TaxID=53985 RepID=A0A6A3R2R8_9STRA|nr:hypothetical protein PF009_g27079 [Phytophthora fragariae]KAE8973347.1 hypothetical protein PF011_g25291 [Phytophthora fragariae]KAE9071862.1 hypothetical protein PF007_g26391 [Phytophthora fragariae]KAE9087519.1 hypothetical protein PF006_g25787 [Phytophthora fragariae]KAE9173218.1 hypothetical protein PF005_g26363 [Phytophthora fragariae]
MILRHPRELRAPVRTTKMRPLLRVQAGDNVVALGVVDEILQRLQGSDHRFALDGREKVVDLEAILGGLIEETSWSEEGEDVVLEKARNKKKKTPDDVAELRLTGTQLNC